METILDMTVCVFWPSPPSIAEMPVARWLSLLADDLLEMLAACFNSAIIVFRRNKPGRSAQELKDLRLEDVKCGVIKLKEACVLLVGGSGRAGDVDRFDGLHGGRIVMKAQTADLINGLPVHPIRGTVLTWPTHS